MPATQFSLALDLSGSTGSIALGSPSGCRHQSLLGERFRFAEELFDQLKRDLEAAEVSLAAIQSWMVPSGPGSFTGLRLGLSVVAALSQVHGTPVTTLSAAEARAIGWFLDHPVESDVLVVTRLSTRRQWIHHFRNGGTFPVELKGRAETFPSKLSSPFTILEDEEAASSGHGGRAMFFPLRAEHLLRAAPHASSVRRYENEGDWLQLDIEYT